MTTPDDLPRPVIAIEEALEELKNEILRYFESHPLDDTHRQADKDELHAQVVTRIQGLSNVPEHARKAAADAGQAGHTQAAHHSTPPAHTGHTGTAHPPHAGSSHAGSGHTATGHTGTGRPDSGHTATGHAGTAHAGTDHAGTDHAATGDTGTGPTDTRHTGTAHAGTGHAAAGHADSAHAATGHTAAGAAGQQGTELSGAAWGSRFRSDSGMSGLAGQFATGAAAFKTAMEDAGITVEVLSTRRRVERAYLMHWSYMIANGKVSADKVPAFSEPGADPVNIRWNHTDAKGAFDSAASVAAAKELAHALGIALGNGVAPSLHSRHDIGEAIDMNTTWSAPSITIRKADGTSVTIDSGPHTGMNTHLWEVGATYGVIHFATEKSSHTDPSKDRNHWSSNGH